MLKLFIMNRIKKEITLCKKEDFKVGEYLYMGMAKLNGKDNTVCISVGYKIDYCIKKGKQFVKLNKAPNNLVFYKINKVKIGELESCEEFKLL